MEGLSVGKIVGGQQSQDGITLHVITSIEGELCGIGFDFYAPSDPNFAWALAVLHGLSD
jgi:hypothetical protein